MDEQLLIRFLTHTCTPEDLRSIDQWIASGKPNADWLFEMERIWSLKDELRFSDRREIEEAYNRFTLSQGKSKNAVGGGGKYLHHRAHALIAANLLHGCLAPFET